MELFIIISNMLMALKILLRLKWSLLIPFRSPSLKVIYSCNKAVLSYEL